MWPPVIATDRRVFQSSCFALPRTPSETSGERHRPADVAVTLPSLTDSATDRSSGGADLCRAICWFKDSPAVAVGEEADANRKC